MTTGKAAVAAVGGAKSMWHGLGEEILKTDSIATIQKKAGLAWEAHKAPVIYKDGKGREHTFGGRQVVFRSDTGGPLGVTSDNRYHIVQPSEVMEFFKDFLADNKLAIETAGAVRGGKIIWCLAKLGKDFQFLMPGKDAIDSYFRLQTSYDLSRSTDGVGTTIRQVCANTMRMVDADADARGYATPHSVKFDAKGLQVALGMLGEQHKLTSQVYNALVKRKVTDTEASKYYLDLFGIEEKDLDAIDKKTKKPVVHTRTKNVLKEIAACFKSSPGAGLKSADGTAFGLLQSVTYYVDHKASVRDLNGDGEDRARLTSAWFGGGDKLKDDAQWFAAELAGVEHLIDREEVVAA
jgi:phage/plasmid-like protein (TIGR03299 family)